MKSSRDLSCTLRFIIRAAILLGPGISSRKASSARPLALADDDSTITEFTLNERARERWGGGEEEKFRLSRLAGRGGIHDIVTNFETARQPPSSTPSRNVKTPMLAGESEIARAWFNENPPLNYIFQRKRINLLFFSAY